jgi:hypothetical protein
VEPLPAIQDRSKFIDQMVEEWGSIDRLQKIIAAQTGGEDPFHPLFSAIEEAAVKLTGDTWRNIMDRFLNAEYWRPLAQRPQAFNVELNKSITSLRRWMKLVYSVKPHCPTKNAARDKTIYELRRKKRTFGEIGIALKISAKAAERAFKRQDQAEKTALRKMLKFVFQCADYKQSQQKRTESRMF